PDPARLHRRAGGAMRLLHRRDDDAGAGLADAQCPAERRGDSHRTRAAFVPVRDAYAHPARHPPRGRTDAPGRAALRAGRHPMSAFVLDRRQVLAGSGALILSFSLNGAFAQDQAAPAPSPPGSLKTSPYLDSWIRIDADGAITVFTGKAELGQGFKTAFQQVAAEELDVAFASLKVVTADTAF